MATRANYIFNDETIIYNHWDNYPEGAVILLQKMLLENNKRGDWATNFLRANKSAVLDTELAGDADYYYYIDTRTEQIKVIELTYNFEKDETTESEFFSGSIYDFINEHLPKNYDLSDFRDKYEIKQNYWKNGTCLKLLQQEICAMMDDFAKSCTYDADNPNKSAKNIIEALEEMKNIF